MLRLIRFNFNCGRMGTLSGIFVLDEDDWATWQELVATKHRIYFGEVLGKHSEITGPISPTDFSVVSEDQDFCHKFQELRCASGHNPLDYLEEEEDEEDEED